MSCSVHDAVELEARGIPTVAIHTEVFMNSAAAHAAAYGRPDYRSVAVRHPIAGLSPEEVHVSADLIVDNIIQELTVPVPTDA